MKWYTSHVTVDDIAITNMTAIPIPMDASMLLEMPKNEQSAMNRMSRMLLTSIALRKIRNKFILLLIMSPPMNLITVIIVDCDYGDI